MTKHKLLVSYVISFAFTLASLITVGFLVGCDNISNKNQSSSVMNEDEYNEYVKKNHQNEISVSCSFKPTLEITDYIRNTSLEDIIIQNPGMLDNYRNSYSGLYDGAYKFVPANSNLAKVYYLQDFNGFMANNSQYYFDVMSKHHSQQQRKREQDAQQEWDKYLR